MDRNLSRLFSLSSSQPARVCKNYSPVDVPDKLKPPASESPAMIVHAKSVQIYECRAKKDQAGADDWAFVAPEADLFDTSGKKIGKHYAGPHWESTDGSKVAGTVKEQAAAPQADAIPWLLLVTKSVGHKVHSAESRAYNA